MAETPGEVLKRFKLELLTPEYIRERGGRLEILERQPFKLGATDRFRKNLEARSRQNVAGVVSDHPSTFGQVLEHVSEVQALEGGTLGVFHKLILLHAKGSE